MCQSRLQLMLCGTGLVWIQGHLHSQQWAKEWGGVGEGSAIGEGRGGEGSEQLQSGVHEQILLCYHKPHYTHTHTYNIMHIGLIH